MGYVGVKPSAVPLTSADITDGIIVNADINASAAIASSKLSITSPLSITGNSTAGSEIRLPEDTDNGSNYVALKAPDTLASNLTLTLPSADGTSGQVLRTNGSGVLSFGGAGKILQVITKKTTTETITNPGTTYTASSQYTQSITPTSATSKILIIANGNVGSSTGGLFVSAFRDSTNLGESVGGIYATTSSNPVTLGISHIDEPTTTSSISYSLRVRRINSDATTVKFNNSIFDAGGVSYNQEGDFILVEIGA